MTNRSTKELLLLLLNRIEKKHKISWGLCYEIDFLYKNEKINIIEMRHLYDSISKNRPTNIASSLSFYWEPGRVKPRIKYLKKLIRNEQNKTQTEDADKA